MMAPIFGLREGSGYNVTPAFYVFAKGDGIFQPFNNSLFDTNGYRVIGGIGSKDDKSLFRGEVYGGYQAQNQQQQQPNVTGLGVPTGIPTDANSGVFGGRLTYYPTQLLDDYSTGRPDIGNFNDAVALHSQGAPTRATSAILQTNMESRGIGRSVPASATTR